MATIFCLIHLRSVAKICKQQTRNLIGYARAVLLHNRVFLTRDYRLLVALRKFDALPTKISFESLPYLFD